MNTLEKTVAILSGTGTALLAVACNPQSYQQLTPTPEAQQTIEAMPTATPSPSPTETPTQAPPTAQPIQPTETPTTELGPDQVEPPKQEDVNEVRRMTLPGGELYILGRTTLWRNTDQNTERLIVPFPESGTGLKYIFGDNGRTPTIDQIIAYQGEKFIQISGSAIEEERNPHPEMVEFFNETKDRIRTKPVLNLEAELELVGVPDKDNVLYDFSPKGVPPNIWGRGTISLGDYIPGYYPGFVLYTPTARYEFTIRKRDGKSVIEVINIVAFPEARDPSNPTITIVPIKQEERDIKVISDYLRLMNINIEDIPGSLGRLTQEYAQAKSILWEIDATMPADIRQTIRPPEQEKFDMVLGVALPDGMVYNAGRNILWANQIADNSKFLIVPFPENVPLGEVNGFDFFMRDDGRSPAVDDVGVYQAQNGRSEDGRPLLYYTTITSRDALHAAIDSYFRGTMSAIDQAKVINLDTKLRLERIVNSKFDFSIEGIPHPEFEARYSEVSLDNFSGMYELRTPAISYTFVIEQKDGKPIITIYNIQRFISSNNLPYKMDPTKQHENVIMGYLELMNMNLADMQGSLRSLAQDYVKAQAAAQSSMGLPDIQSFENSLKFKLPDTVIYKSGSNILWKNSVADNSIFTIPVSKNPGNIKEIVLDDDGRTDDLDSVTIHYAKNGNTSSNPTFEEMSRYFQDAVAKMAQSPAQELEAMLQLSYTFSHSADTGKSFVFSIAGLPLDPYHLNTIGLHHHPKEDGTFSMEIITPNVNYMMRQNENGDLVVYNIARLINYTSPHMEPNDVSKEAVLGYLRLMNIDPKDIPGSLDRLEQDYKAKVAFTNHWGLVTSLALDSSVQPQFNVLLPPQNSPLIPQGPQEAYQRLSYYQRFHPNTFGGKDGRMPLARV